MKLILATLLLVSCSPTVRLHEDATLAHTTGGKVCYTIDRPKQIVGRYCLERVK